MPSTTRHAACRQPAAADDGLLCHCDGRRLSLNWCDKWTRVDARHRVPDRQCLQLPAWGDGWHTLPECGLARSESAPITVLVFDGLPGWNLSGGPGELSYRHEPFGKGAHCLLADWSVSYIKRDGSRPARWEP